MKKKEPKIAYAVKDNLNLLLLETISHSQSLCEDFAKDYYDGSPLKWPDLKSMGYKIVKICIEEVSQ